LNDRLEKWVQHLEALHPDKIELGLDRIKAVAIRAGLSNPNFKCITVAGTNGKGSTVAYIRSILAASGYKVGVYTSPHFIDFAERVVIDTQQASADNLCNAFESIEAVREDTPLTYFEFTTLAAIHCFRSAGIDVALLEVGLGGRLDAVNAWDADVACITSIGIDHVDWLGDDRARIAEEKAGVARRGKPLVCGELSPPTSIETVCDRVGAQLIQRNRDFHVEAIDADKWRYVESDYSISLPNPAIDATWARDNAAVAISACRAFVRECSGVVDNSLTDDSIALAIKNTTVIGRLQKLVHNDIELILDVAHNEAAATKLCEYLDNAPVAGVTRAVFGCMKDKDLDAIINAVQQPIDEWFVSSLDTDRGLPASDIAQCVTQNARVDESTGQQVSCMSFATVIQAVEAAVAQSSVIDRVVVFGSFHVVAPVLGALANHSQ